MTAGAHASGETVYVGDANQFYTHDPVGTPLDFPLVEPWINVANGTIWTVEGGVWVVQRANGLLDLSTGVTCSLPAANGGAQGAHAAYPVATAGVQTPLPAVSSARVVLIRVEVTTAFADGDGAQPTFALGVTGDADAFAATTVFADAALGDVFTFGGVVDADDAVIVTATAGTGTATGAIAVTIIAAQDVNA